MKESWQKSIERVPIRVFDGDNITETREPVIKELPFGLSVNGRDLVVLACTGMYLEELAAGWLRSEGMISSRDDIESIEIDPEVPRAAVKLNKDIAAERTVRAVGSSGGRGIVSMEPEIKEARGPVNPSEVRVSPRQVLTLMRSLMQSSKIHDLTRGTHCSALAHAGGIILAREDIGRHNTIDMLGGWSLLNGIDCGDKLLLTTGRVSSEIIMKAFRIGVSFIISHSAATSGAIALSRELGISLVGYVRGGRFKIYAGGRRIAARARKKPGGAKGAY